MSLRVIIPVKPFTEAKQRLASVLSGEQRAELAEKLFRHAFTTVLRAIGARAVIIVTRSRDVIDFAAAQGAVGLAETGHPDLNTALWQAAEFASGASKLLILASDLPLLCEEDFVAMAVEHCAIAPDRHGAGTNALTWPANPSLGFHFGTDSFERHRAAAISAGFVPRIVTRAGLGYDVDLPADLVPLRL
jgi:2-phospho-L-lactate guanylyltransferase